MCRSVTRYIGDPSSGEERCDLSPLARRGGGEAAGPGRLLTPPKSDAGRRTVAVPAFVLKALEVHTRDDVGAAVDAWVFTRPSGLPLRRADLSHPWKRACAALG
jgi:hypothetical protein